jgi:acetoin utilization protein AcuB
MLSPASVCVSSVMSRRVVSVDYDDRLRTVKKLFDQHGFHHLLVVEQGRLHGVLSDRDLLRALSPFIGTLSETTRDAETLDRRVHQVMTRRLTTLGPEATLAEAIDVFLAERVSCLPVIDASRHPLGILSWRDVLRALRAP